MATRTHQAAKALWIPLLVAIVALSITSTWAQVTTTVRGTVVDSDGNPMPKVAIVLKTVQVEGRGVGVTLGKVKTKKDGGFKYPFVAPGQYQVIPEWEGYKVLQVKVLSIDSQKQLRMDQTFLISREQENHPAIPVAPEGRGATISGRCQVDFIMVKDEDFRNALAALQKGQEEPEEVAAPAAPIVSQKQDAVERGDEYYAGQDYDQAAEAYQEAADEDPSRADAFYGLGKSLLKKDDLSGAQNALMKAGQLDPEMPGVNFYLATIYHSLAQDAAAIAALEKERVNTPGEENVLVNLGSLYRDTDQPQKAMEVLTEVAELYPENTDAFLALADVHNQMGETAKAEEVYRQILASNPGQEDIIWYNIGVNAYNANNKAEAASAFEKSIEANPRNPEAHRMLGYTQMGLGDPEGAASHFKSYLKLEPKGEFVPEVKAFLAQIGR